MNDLISVYLPMACLIMASLYMLRGIFFRNCGDSDAVKHYVAKAINSRNIRCRLQHGLICFEGSPLSMDAELVKTTRLPKMYTVQLDIRIPVPGRGTLIESFGGFGRTVSDAIQDSIENFLRSSLDVIAKSFLSYESSRVGMLEYFNGGRKHVFFIGELALRGNLDAHEVSKIHEWRTSIESIITSTEFPSGISWMRYCFTQNKNEFVGGEVLVNNNENKELFDKLSTISLPDAGCLYFIRQFMIIGADEFTVT